MSSIYKKFTSNDVRSTRTNLHEGIPVDGLIVSGTYSDENIKNYGHGMWQSVYDYPYLSASSNHIFDLGAAVTSGTALVINTQEDKKKNMYASLAKILAGLDTDGVVQEFDRDGNIIAGGDKLQEVFFINLARLLTKDEIKKGSFSFSYYEDGAYPTPSAGGTLITLQDWGAESNYKVNSPAGEYGILYSGSAAVAGTGLGLVFYQAGIAILTASIFTEAVALYDDGVDTYADVDELLTTGSIESCADAFRHRFDALSLINTTELNSTVYFCRLNHREFNYSSNPTYVSGGKIVNKEKRSDIPSAYFTGIGLYSADGELLATAKTSEPIKKRGDDDFVVRVRLDY